MKKVLIIGPFPKPITGMALANKVVLKLLNSSSKFKADFINTAYVEFDEKLGQFSFKKMFFYLKFNLKLFKIIQNDSIYITPGQTFFGILKYFFFIIISALFQKEIIIHIHGNHLKNAYKNLTGNKKKIVYFLLSKTTKGIVLSTSLKDNLTPFIKEKKIYVLYNFAQDYLIKNSREKSYNILKIVFLSNLMLEKGIIELFQALKILENKNIYYEAKIAGNIDTTNNKIIQKHLKTLKNTEYIGVVTGKHKKDLLDWSTVFILPTYYKMEGQPISIIEAMATGNCIITTKHAGIPDIINEGKNGYLVKKQHIKSIVDVLTFANQNSNEIARIAKNNKEDFQDKYTLNHFKNNIIEILNS